MEALKTNHEEGDSLICTHVSHIDSTKACNIAVRASVTDVAIILFNHCERLSGHNWIDTGTSAKNNRRFIDITSISKALETQLCQTIPRFHAYTGLNYASAFYKKMEETSTQTPKGKKEHPNGIWRNGLKKLGTDSLEKNHVTLGENVCWQSKSDTLSEYISFQGL